MVLLAVENIRFEKASAFIHKFWAPMGEPMRDDRDFQARVNAAPSPPAKSEPEAALL